MKKKIEKKEGISKKIKIRKFPQFQEVTKEISFTIKVENF